jgi:hypothetical protein
VSIPTDQPYSDGWWLQQLYSQLRTQKIHADDMHKRFIGDPPLPAVNENQKDATRWFIRKARTNFERLIVNAVLSRLRIRGIRTAVDPDEGGDAEAFTTWRKARGKLWSREVAKFALSMGRGYVMVGRDPRTGKLIVTAEDPRKVTIITDPADPLRAVAGLKLIFDPVAMKDRAYLFLLDEGNTPAEDRVRMRIATRDRSVSTPVSGYQFDAQAFDWASLGEDDNGVAFQDYEPEWLQADDTRAAVLPIVQFENEDGMAEFEPHVEILDRITQQILQRMTIATVQAFKQRAFKGLPKTDPATGEEIDYDDMFSAEPGAVWQLPASVEVWESGEANMQGVLLSIRDDIKDLSAVSGTPLYTVTPDVAQGSAEGASLQRETLTFKVESRQETWELPHSLVAELIFRTTGDDARAEPGTVEIMWAPGDRPSMSERANAMAQTKGIMPTYMQLTDIWGLDPNQADSAMTLLQQDATRAAALAAITGGGQQQQQPQNRPDIGNGQNPRPQGLPDVTRPVQPRQQAASAPAA